MASFAPVANAWDGQTISLSRYSNEGNSPVHSDDLSKLFQRVGGTSQDYRQIVREDSVLQARGRWPLLASGRAATDSARRRRCTAYARPPAAPKIAPPAAPVPPPPTELATVFARLGGSGTPAACSP
ncbi:BcsR/BcsP family cellulose biosynthesis protein [Cupriavidus basilensis]|uniref:BcsR/BcsP family cellulose biosynthesis protein n=1 Tax=Cupriavidus basilensis TaxID=68895 RepID=UPI003D32FFC5